MTQPFTLEAAIDSFSRDVRHKAQQEMSRLRGCVRDETISAERASFDQLEASALEARVGRHVKTNWGDPDGDRRWVIPNPFDKAFQIDKPELLRLLMDPTSEYVTNMAMAAGRAIDDVIIASLRATAVSGRNGTGTTAYDTNNDIAAGGVGFTFDKSLQAVEILNANEEPEMDRCIAFAARQLRDILDEPEFTSADFATVRALQQGRMSSFLGFDEWVRIQRLDVDGSSDRLCPFWQKTAVLLGMAMEGSATVDRLPEHRNSTGIQYQIDMGAVRMRETGVGHIACVE